MPTTSEVRAPTAASRIPLSEPILAGNEWIYLKECLDSGWLSSVGPFVDRFEREFAAYVGGAHQAVAVVNGTAGLHVALRAAGVRPGEEVLVPALTFIAPVNAIRYCHAHPVFMDADPQAWQMDVKKLTRFLEDECELRPDVAGPDGSATTCWNKRSGRKVRAILPVHLLGLACEIDTIVALAKRYSLRVIEDAAEAIGVRYRDRYVGTWGDLGVFSFNGNKTMTSGGGGMVVTKTPYANVVRYLSMQARDDAREYYHADVGYNYRLSNLHAAVGVAQLEQVERLLGRKRAIAAAYQQALSDLKGITLMPRPAATAPAYWLYTVLLKAGTTVEERNRVLDRLVAEGLQARALWQPIHTLPPYQHCQAFEISVAPDLRARAISLPSSVGVSDEELRRCIAIVRRVLTNAP